MLANRYVAPAMLTLLVLVACVGYLIVLRSVLAPAALPTRRLDELPDSPYLNTKPGVAYVGDDACARCHAEIARSYSGHPMGRSMTDSPGPEPKADGVVFKAGDLAYSIVHRDGRIYHRETRQDAQGGTRNSTEAYVRYVLGSGRRGFAFLVERENGLYQSPITWYTEGHRWGLAPVYATRNLHFDRPIAPGCLFCPATGSMSPPGSHRYSMDWLLVVNAATGPANSTRRAETGQRPRFDDREPCAPDAAFAARVGLRAVSLDRHVPQEQTRPTPFEYRPGLPFDAFMTVSAAVTDPMAKRRIVGHFDQMRQSRCYLESKAELGCSSCHDSHRLPTAVERVSFYQSRCMKCHAERGCSLPLDRRRAQKPNDDCTACHMPRIPSAEIAHTGVTLHSIPRNPPAPH